MPGAELKLHMMPDGVQAVDWMWPTRRPNASIAALVCHARAAACFDNLAESTEGT